MCGYLGVVGVPHQTESVTTSGKAALQHRGPDAAGHWSQAVPVPVTFVSTRLAIIDLSPAGHMPMQSPNEDFVISYNGEVYNFGEIRTALISDGIQFRSDSDTEVILQSYIRWGKACVDKFRGMFSFAIWDRKQQTLFAARDRLGIKPLYYAQVGNGIVFGSELKSILSTGLVKPEFNTKSLALYLANYSIPAPHTALVGVSALPPGHMLSLEAGRLHVERYWALPTANNPHGHSRADAVARIRELLHDSIRLRMIADVPVGAFLSGGIDSSAVVALMTKISGQQLKTFSIGFTQEGASLDELSYARQTAKRFDTDHTEVVVSGQDVRNNLDAMVRGIDQPSGDGLNTFLVSQATAQHVKVALSGLGGDELFAGYPQFRSLSQHADYARTWQRLPSVARSPLRAALKTAGNLTGRAGLRKLPDYLSADTLTRYAQTRTLFDAQQRNALLNITSNSDPLAHLRAFVEPNADLINQISRFELQGYMARTLLRDSDAMSMAHSLELRVPLIDHELVEYVIGLPGDYKTAGTAPKSLLVEALDGLIPDEIVHRKKQGFEMPIASWLKNELRDVIEDTLSEQSVKRRGLLNPNTVTKAKADFYAGRGVYMHVWALALLELWQREFIDG